MEDLKLHVTNIHQLHKTFMPFIKRGAIFISTEQAYQLQAEIPFKLQLLDDSEQSLLGKVIWINPPNSNLTPGIGLQFCDQNAQAICDKIQDLLRDYPNLTETTETM